VMLVSVCGACLCLVSYTVVVLLLLMEGDQMTRKAGVGLKYPTLAIGPITRVQPTEPNYGCRDTAAPQGFRMFNSYTTTCVVDLVVVYHLCVLCCVV
jgi:hypothetical protein